MEKFVFFRHYYRYAKKLKFITEFIVSSSVKEKIKNYANKKKTVIKINNSPFIIVIRLLVFVIYSVVEF